jgi:hypothetical protein
VSVGIEVFSHIRPQPLFKVCGALETDVIPLSSSEMKTMHFADWAGKEV